LGPSCPPRRKGQNSPPLFGPCLWWSNGRPSQLLPNSCMRWPRLCNNKCSAAEMGDRGILIHQTVNWLQQTRAENWEGVVPPFSWGLGPHLTHCGHGRGLPAHGRKIGWGRALFFWGELGPQRTLTGYSACRTFWRGLWHGHPGLLVH